MYTSVKPHFYYIKVGCKGVFIAGTSYHDEYCCNHPLIQTNWPYNGEMPPKDANSLAKSAYIEEQSDQGLHSLLGYISSKIYEL